MTTFLYPYLWPITGSEERRYPVVDAASDEKENAGKTEAAD